MTVITKPFPIQMARNPWKRGGVYFRGRLAPWVGAPENLRPKQKAVVTAFIAASPGCIVTGVEKGVTKRALCMGKALKGKKY
ncbi:MAG: hypothetical protein AB1420_15825 [Bacillota bacterium]